MYIAQPYFPDWGQILADIWLPVVANSTLRKNYVFLTKYESYIHFLLADKRE